MNRATLATAIKTQLIAQTWTGSSNVVFPSGGVVISRAVDAKWALSGGMPWPLAQIMLGDFKSDPEYGEEPDFLIGPVIVRLYQIAPGDTMGEAPIMGANRSDATMSEGAGLYQIEQEVYNAIGKLNSPTIIIQFRQMGASGGEILDNRYIAFEEIEFEAVCTAV